MRVLKADQIAAIQALSDEMKEYGKQTQSMMDELDAKTNVEFDPTRPDTYLDSVKELQERIAQRIGYERTMVDQMAARLDLDLTRPVDEQMQELLNSLDGNRRLSGTGRTQRKVEGNRKSSRRRRRGR